MERLLGNQEEQKQSGRSKNKWADAKEEEGHPAGTRTSWKNLSPSPVRETQTPQALFPSGGSERVGKGCGKREGLRRQVLGSSEPPALLLSQDHLHIRVLLLLEAPVGAVVTVRTPGGAEGREGSKSIPSRKGSDGK